MLELLTLLAGILTTGAPLVQVIRTIRTRIVDGLSAPTYILICISMTLGTIMGIQYGVVVMTAQNAVNLVLYLIILNMISRRAFTVLCISLCSIALLLYGIFPGFAHALLTRRLSEPVAFIQGLSAACMFLPQVFLTRRTRRVEALSLPYFIMMAFGLIVWVLFGLAVGTWSIVLWCSIMFAAVLEMIRLKVVESRKAL